MGCFEIEKEAGKARAGVLTTVHGIVKTPFFMPVATKAVSKHVTSSDLVSVGAKAIISNAFIQSLLL